MAKTMMVTMATIHDDDEDGGGDGDGDDDYDDSDGDGDDRWRLLKDDWWINDDIGWRWRAVALLCFPRWSEHHCLHRAKSPDAQILGKTV